MAGRRSPEREAERRLRRFEEESLMLEKREEEFEVFEEVFDRPTLEGLYKLMRKGVIDKIYGVVKAGKEGRIYWGKDPRGYELAVKIYYTVTGEFRHGMMKYIEGDPRFKRVRRDPRGLVYTWTQKEFKNLKLAEEAGVNVPRPIECFRNILVMSFIGVDGVPAPLLREVELPNPEDFYKRLIEDVRRLYLKAGLIHGDLSEYNIMVWEEAPVIFDVSQAVLTAHPNAGALLRRDIERINEYFSRLGVDILNADSLEVYVRGGEEELYQDSPG